MCRKRPTFIAAGSSKTHMDHTGHAITSTALQFIIVMSGSHELWLRSDTKSSGNGRLIDYDHRHRD